MFFFEDVVRVRAGERADRGGNTVPDWAPDVVGRLTIGPLNIQPASQDELTEAARAAVKTGWRVQSDYGTRPDVTAADRIEWRGLTYEVDGDVAEWPDPLFPGVDHVEFTMVRTTG